MYTCGVDIAEDKHIYVSLQQVFGIGPAAAGRILSVLGIGRNTLTRDLSRRCRLEIKQVMERQLKLGDELRQQISENIAVLKDIGCYRGLRHRKNLPVRGQRTRTNAHTRKYYASTADGV
ncbi:30S ribosomal protein S13 [Candidatus Hodgkinia cicadicola]